MNINIAIAKATSVMIVVVCFLGMWSVYLAPAPCNDVVLQGVSMIMLGALSLFGVIAALKV